MKQLNKKQVASNTAQKQRLPWIKPVVQKIKAGEAEIGTRMSADGEFTAS
jgi:hypothetical protein